MASLKPYISLCDLWIKKRYCDIILILDLCSHGFTFPGQQKHLTSGWACWSWSSQLVDLRWGRSMCKADWIFLMWGCLKTKGQKHIHPIWIAFVARRICDEVVVITTMHLNEHFVLGHPYRSSWDINWTIWNSPGRRDFNHCLIRNKKRCHVTQFCLLQTAHSSGLFLLPRCWSNCGLAACQRHSTKPERGSKSTIVPRF